MSLTDGNAHRLNFVQGALGAAAKEKEDMRENGASTNCKAVRRNDLPAAPAEMDTRLILDDELASAAAPFLYLLASLSAVIVAYTLYSLLHG